MENVNGLNICIINCFQIGTNNRIINNEKNWKIELKILFSFMYKYKTKQSKL